MIKNTRTEARHARYEIHLAKPEGASAQIPVDLSGRHRRVPVLFQPALDHHPPPRAQRAKRDRIPGRRLFQSRTAGRHRQRHARANARLRRHPAGGGIPEPAVHRKRLQQQHAADDPPVCGRRRRLPGQPRGHGRAGAQRGAGASGRIRGSRVAGRLRPGALLRHAGGRRDQRADHLPGRASAGQREIADGARRVQQPGRVPGRDRQRRKRGDRPEGRGNHDRGFDGGRQC